MRSFFDTNILIYMYDNDAPGKKERACQLFETEASDGRALLSTQVLQEFYVSVTRKLAVPLFPEEAEVVLRHLSLLPVVQINKDMICSAAGRSRMQRLSFWDARVIEAALAGGASRLLSEDMQNGQVIDGLTIENPFAS